MNNKIKITFFSIAALAMIGLSLISPRIALADQIDQPQATQAQTAKPNTAILDPDWGIEDILRVVLSVMTVGVGVAATGSFAMAGFLYTTAGNDSNGNVKKAKTMISNTVLGIIAYIFMWAIINWIIPGGLF